MKNISLLGAGGMSSEILSLLEYSYQYKIDYLYDSTIKKNKKKDGYLISNNFDNYSPHLIAVGYPETKVKIIKSIKGHLKLARPYIHALCVRGKNINIGAGSVIYPLVALTSNISIGPMASINSMVTISHDCKIGEMFHASPGTIVSGNVKIGDRVFLGANSTIKENISICDDVIIGAGSVVIKNITKPGVYAGCPTKSI